MDKLKRAEEAFERVWNNFRLDKARLRTLNEKEKAELKELMKTVFLSSMSVGEIPAEVSFKLEGDGNQEEVEGTVRKVLREELGGISGLLEEIKNRSSETRVLREGSGSAPNAQDSVELHARMFEAKMNTNIDKVKVSGEEVQNVTGNLEALRRLQKKNEEGES